MVKPPFSLVGIIALVAIFTQQENIRNRWATFGPSLNA
jgi:hypothetical protein